MFPLISSLITGGLGLAGSMFSSNTSAANNAANIQMQQQTNQMQIEENQKNRDYQTQMSNSAYQRSSADMKAAGLNPMMMFGGGSAASSPSGGVPQLTAPKNTENPGRAFENLGDIASKAVNSAVSMKTFEKMTEEIAKVQADTAVSKAVEATEKERPSEVRERTFNTMVSTAREQNQMPVSRLKGKEAEAVLDMPAWLRDTLTQAGWSADKGGKVVDVLGDVASSALGMKRLFKGSRTTTQRSNNRGDDSFEERFHY